MAQPLTLPLNERASELCQLRTMFVLLCAALIAPGFVFEMSNAVLLVLFGLSMLVMFIAVALHEQVQPITHPRYERLIKRAGEHDSALKARIEEHAREDQYPRVFEFYRILGEIRAGEAQAGVKASHNHA